MTLAIKVITVEGGWTEERYFAEAPESRIVEFEDGDLIVPSPVNIRHQEVVGFLTFLLRGYTGTKGLGRVFNGPAVVRLRPGLDYEPDIFMVLSEHLHQLETQYFSGAPDLVVEVVSPGGRNYDLKTKASNYRAHGVREYWVIDADEQVLYQHTPPPAQTPPYVVKEYPTGHIESLVLPGFWIDVSWLWATPLPAEKPLLDQLLQEKAAT